VHFDGSAYDISKDNITVTRIEETGRGQAAGEKRSFQRSVEFAPRKASAWEIAY
jgi:hypothetical protein